MRARGDRRQLGFRSFPASENVSDRVGVHVEAGFTKPSDEIFSRFEIGVGEDDPLDRRGGHV
jgi:hypothetical protein